MAYRTLYTGGTFDLFHSGHVNFLKMCKTLADNVVVSLNTDEFIHEYKGFTPFYSYSEREILLSSCIYVDCVIPNLGGKDSKVSIEKVQPDIIAIGTDWAKKDYYSQMAFTQQWLDENGITLVYLPYTEGISSTEIKKRIGEAFSKK